MITGLFDSGAMPALERLTQFTAQRHELILHNVANISTPHHRARDLPVERFQEALGEAIDRRRRENGGPTGKLEPRDSGDLRFRENGIEARADRTRDNILFHDRNDRNLERLMSDLAQNTLTHNTAVELLRNQFQMLETAIRGRL